MDSPFKKFLKTLGLLILIFVISFSVYKYNKLKKSGSLDDIWSMSKVKEDVVYTEGELADPYKKNDSQTTDERDTQSSGSSEGNFFTEKQNYDDYYNKFNFDNFILLYEGDQHAQESIVLINRLIADADDPLYSKPRLDFVNFNGLTTTKVGPEDLEMYKQVLNQAKADIRGSDCNFTFGYAALNSVVNHITITKK